MHPKRKKKKEKSSSRNNVIIMNTTDNDDVQCNFYALTKNPIQKGKVYHEMRRRVKKQVSSTHTRLFFSATSRSRFILFQFYPVQPSLVIMLLAFHFS